MTFILAVSSICICDLFHMPDLDTDDGVHVDPGEMPGLYHGDADLVVLRCQTVGPCSARADG